MKTIGQLARLARVSVRTLRHYDDIDLLRPTGRSDTGIRLYNDDAVLRLHTIVWWRSLGFPLQEIRELLDAPDHDTLEALRAHRARLAGAHADLREQLDTLDGVLAEHTATNALTDTQVSALFDGFDVASTRGAARDRWGDTDAWRQSQRRAAAYDEATWLTIRHEIEQIETDFAELLRRRIAPDDDTAAVVALAHQRHVTTWFYDCSAALHLGLAELYTADPRFRRHYDHRAEGLAHYVAAVIRALHRDHATPPS